MDNRSSTFRRCSDTSTRTSGSTSVEFTTSICAERGSTTSRIPGERRSLSGPTRSTIPGIGAITERTSGDLRQLMAHTTLPSSSTERRGPDHRDDRELSQRSDLEDDAEESVHRGGIEKSGLYRRLAQRELSGQ